MFRSRGVVVALALVLAAAATAGVFSYVRSVETNAGGGPAVAVIVAKDDIAAGTALDEVIRAGGLRSIEVPRDALVRNAVTSLAQLRGRETAVPIVAGEQISTAKLSGTSTVAGGTLGIPDGHQALTLPLDASRVVGGAVKRGDRVAVYGTMRIRGSDTTVALVPGAVVLGVGSQATGDRQTVRRGANPAATLVTLALTPRQAQAVILAQESGDVWLTLLPPNERGVRQSPLTDQQVAARRA